MKQILLVIIFLGLKISAQNTLEIPFEYKNNLIYIDLDVNDKKEKFIFDTGAPNVVTENFADAIGLNLKSSRNVNGYLGKTKAYKASIPRINIEGKILSDVKVRVVDWKFLNDLNIAGIFSFDNALTLGYKTFSIDYKNKNIIFGTQTPAHYDYKFKMTNKGNPRIIVDNVKFLIDTGNPLFGEANSQAFKISENCQKISFSSLSFVNRNKDLCNNILKDEDGKNFILNYFKFENPRNVIGNLVLQNYKVFIDLDKRELFLEENRNFSYPVDVYFFQSEKGFFIAMINEDSQLYKSGIREGFFVEKVNDRNSKSFIDAENLNQYIKDNKIKSINFLNIDNKMIEINDVIIK